jgi:PA14 domain/Domain of unknown function (DUF5011)/Bacterial Ig domain/Secretion system C-terminal sorting domain
MRSSLKTFPYGDHVSLSLSASISVNHPSTVFPTSIFNNINRYFMQPKLSVVHSSVKMISKLLALVLIVTLFQALGNSARAQMQYPVYSGDSATYQAALAQYDQQKQASLGARSGISTGGHLSTPKATKTGVVENAIFGGMSRTKGGISGSSSSSNMRTISESCLIPTDATWSVLGGNDDGSTGQISLGFNFDLYGTTYTSCWINNNGNITFNNAFGGYTPSGFPLGGTPMVSAFWDDIDTRTCGTVRYKLFGTRLVVSYENVGQYSTNCSLLNTFQIVIGTTNDPLLGFGQNVKFFYGDMAWTKGASTVGINSGDGTNYVQVGRFGIQGSTAYDGGGGATDGLDYLDYQCFSFNVSSVGNQEPSMSGFPTGNTVTLGCGQTATYTIQSLPPEVNQLVTTTVNTNGMCGVTTSVTNGAVSTVNISVTGLPCNAGTNTITFTSTDNGSPALTTTSTLTVIVGFATPTISPAGPVSVCGGSVLLTASSGGSYQWFTAGGNIPGATGQTYNATATGDYSVAVTNGSCTVNSIPTHVEINPAPAAVISASGPTTFCQGGSVTLTSSAGSSYLWSTGATTQSITVASPGNYSVTVTGPGGCSATSAATSVAYTTGPDSDGDGKPDACDADDDNDGIPDATECNKSNFFWSNPPTVSGYTATGVINGINYTYTSSQPVLTTPTVFNHSIFPVSYNVPNIKCIQNIYASNNTLTFSSPITNPVLVFSSIGGGPISVPIEFSNPIDVLWSTAVVKNSATRITGTEGYAIVRLNGVFSSISFNYLANENYVNFLFGADFQTCGDTDGDGTPDYLDTDSDNDGCSDAIEGDQNPGISFITNGRLTGGIDANGIPLIVNGGQGSGTSQTANVNCNCQPGIDKTPPTLILNASGGALSSLGTVNTYITAVPGSGTGGLSHAHGIAYDLQKNTVWVTDQDLGNDVVEFPATQPGGSTINQISRFHPALSGTIEGIAFDATDNTLWIVDFNGMVGHFSRTGTTLPGGFNISGTIPAGTFGARALGIGLEGSYIWIDNGQRAYRFNKSGGSYTNFNFVTGAPGITYDPERHLLWSSGWNDGRYRAYNPANGALVFTSNIISISQGHDLSIGAGRIWVSSENSFRDPVYSIDIIGGALDQIIECHSTYTDPGYTATDNCGAVNVVVTGAVNANAPNTYILTYTATDINGNVSTATRTVTVLDRTPPVPDVATLPTITGQCSATVTAPTATDACAGVITGTTGNLLSYNQPGTYTISWSYTDGNSNTTIQQQTVIVNDNTAPTITCPGNQVLASCETVIPNYTTSAIVSDNCTATGSIIITQSPVAGSPIAPGATVTVTLTAKDAANNVSTPCSFTVNRPDITPVANNDIATVCAGSAVSVNVLNNDSHPQGAALTINDFTTPSVGTVVKNANNTFTYNAPAGYSGPVTFTYTIKASDATIGFSGNGHYYEWVPAYAITWADAKAQAATKVYNGLRGYLVTVTSQTEMNFVSTKIQGQGWMGASDLSYEGTWRWVTGPEGLEDGGLGRHFSNQFKYNNCGANTAPGINGNFSNWGPGEPNDCGANVGQYSPTDVNRGGEHYAHFFGAGLWNDYPNNVGGNITGYIVEYGGLEGCIPQLTATATVTINVNATPTATIAAAGSTTACPGSAVTLNATGNTNGGTLQQYQWMKNNSPVPGANAASYPATSTGSYSVMISNTNGCSTTSNTINVTIIDVTPPVPNVATLPAITAECSATVTAPTATDNCTGTITATTTDPVNYSAQGNYTIKWTYNDGNGNAAIQFQSVEIRDVTPPSVTCPAPQTILLGATCAATIPDYRNLLVTSDNCVGAISIVQTPAAGTIVNGSQSIQVNFVVTDAVGNSSNCSMTVSVTDVTPPTLGGAVGSITANYYTGTNFNSFKYAETVSSIGNNWGGGSPNPGVLGNDFYSIRYTSQFTAPVSGVYNFRTLTDDGVRLYVNNQLIINAWGVFPPTNFYGSISLTAGQSVPVSMEYFENGGGAVAYLYYTTPGTQEQLYGGKSCKDATIYLDANGQAVLNVNDVDNGYTDNCGIATRTLSKTNFNCGNVGSNSVTLTVTDINGNSATCTVNVTVIDNIAPALAGVPGNSTVECDNIPAPAIVTASDNCSASLPVVYTETRVNGNCISNYLLQRTWKATDASGNSTSATQVITVQDTHAPTFTRPADITLYTDANCSYNASLAVTGDVTNENDNCSTGIQATYSDVITDGNCEGTHVITRTWHLSDNCGNAAANQVQIITVLDNIAPTFTRPADITIYTDANCSYDASVAATGDVSDEADNCSTGIQATYSDVVTNGPCAGTKVITRTWHLTDKCGNAAADQVQIITVSDNTAPVITSVTASVFHCYDDNVNGSYSVPVITATDNCTSAVNYTYTVVAPNGSTLRSGAGNNASGTFITGTNVVKWTMKDDCGNTTLSETVVVINPEITGVMSNFTVLPQGVQANTLYLGYTPASSATISIAAAGGTAPYTYSWSTNGSAASFTVVAGNPAAINITAVAAGTFTYTVVVTDSKGCKAVFTKTITVVDIRCGHNNDKVIVCHVPPGNPGNPQLICIAASAVDAHLVKGSYLGACNGSYVVREGAPKPVIKDEEATIMVYPNPNAGRFNLKLSDFKAGKVKIEITDGRGKQVMTRDANVSFHIEEITLDLSKLAAGVYNIKVTGEKEVKVTRVIIAR